MKRFDLVLGSILCLYVVLLNIFAGIISFSIPVLILGVLLISFHFIKKKIYENHIANKYFKYFKMVLLIGLIVWAVILTLITVFPKKNTTTVDYIIILGAGIRGENLSITLRQRLDKAIDYINNYDDKCYIVLSGGQGEGEDIPEAEAMRWYLVESGIDEGRIIKEDNSTNTFENFNYSKNVIEEHSGQQIKDIKVKVVTSDFHAFRSSILAKRNGYGDVNFYTNFTFPTLIPIAYARESIAVIKSLVFDR